jgi:hypothetical protein
MEHEGMERHEQRHEQRSATANDPDQLLIFALPDQTLPTRLRSSTCPSLEFASTLTRYQTLVPYHTLNPAEKETPAKSIRIDSRTVACPTSCVRVGRDPLKPLFWMVYTESKAKGI